MPDRRPFPNVALLPVAALLALVLVALTACGASGATETSGSAAGAEAGKGRKVGLKRIGSFDAPVFVAAAPGAPKLLFVVEQGGKVIVLRGGRPLRRPFLDISDLVSSEGERGLLSIAFPPDYGSSGRFYVYYTANDGDIRVDEFKRRTAVRASPDSRRPVLEVEHSLNSNHNGGQLQFLGDLLFIGTGDGGAGGDPPNNAQNRESLLGKLLRIDPRPEGGNPYSVPSSNPFVGRPGRDEIYSLGLRNPFRFSFDLVSKPGSPRLTIGDVGQNRIEEIDYLPVDAAAGANFGWDAFEGNSVYDEESSGTPDPGGTVKPIFAFSHDRGGSCSVTGGYVVADRRLRGLYKRYVYADFCEGELRSLVPTQGGARKEMRLGVRVGSPTSFGEDGRGHLYVASLEGPVYRLVSR